MDSNLQTSANEQGYYYEWGRFNPNIYKLAV